MAKFFIPTPLRKFTASTASVDIEALSLGQAITTLVTLYPDLSRHLLDDQQKIRSFVRLYVGDTDYQDLEGEDTQLNPGDTISIVPAIAGGIY
jgi:molybdopterin converting factor small subunit